MIIQSKLDTDFYKLTMGYYLKNQGFRNNVVYRFINRSESIDLARYIDLGRLREELDHVHSLTLTSVETEYLERIFGNRHFPSYFATLKLPPYRLSKSKGQLNLTFHGNWDQAIYWETPALAIISELFYEGFMKEQGIDAGSVRAKGVIRLQHNLDKLAPYLNSDALISDFGTRRRFSQFWQATVLNIIRNTRDVAPYYVGTSNVQLSQAHNTPPQGTIAHELFMGYAALQSYTDLSLRMSQLELLKNWFNFWIGRSNSRLRPLSALTDTWGTKAFWNDISNFEDAIEYKSFRHDSGCPFEFGENAIAYHKDKWGPDSLRDFNIKLVYSDSLDVDIMIRLINTFGTRVKLLFGWGTNLTNDVGMPTPSIVIKLAKIHSLDGIGYDCVKLSDNPAKAIGPPALIQHYKDIFRYEEKNSEFLRS